MNVLFSSNKNTVTVSLVPPDMVSVHLCVLCPPRQYHKIQLRVWSLQRIDHLPKEFNQNMPGRGSFGL